MARRPKGWQTEPFFFLLSESPRSRLCSALESFNEGLFIHQIMSLVPALPSPVSYQGDGSPTKPALSSQNLPPFLMLHAVSSLEMIAANQDHFRTALSVSTFETVLTASPAEWLQVGLLAFQPEGTQRIAAVTLPPRHLIPSRTLSLFIRLPGSMNQ